MDEYVEKILQEVIDETAGISDDTERIKAMIMYEKELHPLGGALRLKKRIADEWQRMERALNYESFWTFINPNPNCERYSTNRMNFIFEILLQCEKDENGEFIDINEKIKENPHYIFERCLPILKEYYHYYEMYKHQLPFLHSWTPLTTLMEKGEWLAFSYMHEITYGMIALWIAVELLFQRLWNLFSSTILSQPQECIVKEKGRSGAMHICYLVCESK